MKRFRVGGTMTISVFVDVEAETAEEAKSKAAECSVMSLCHQCASNHIGEWSTSSELDGEVTVNADDEVIVLGERRRGR